MLRAKPHAGHAAPARFTLRTRRAHARPAPHPHPHPHPHADRKSLPGRRKSLPAAAGEKGKKEKVKTPARRVRQSPRFSWARLRRRRVPTRLRIGPPARVGVAGSARPPRHRMRKEERARDARSASKTMRGLPNGGLDCGSLGEAAVNCVAQALHFGSLAFCVLFRFNPRTMADLEA